MEIFSDSNEDCDMKVDEDNVVRQCGELRWATKLCTLSMQKIDASVNKEIDQQVMRFIELQKTLNSKVKGNVKEAQERQKKHYDARHLKGYYEVNQKVMLKNMKKLTTKWLQIGLGHMKLQSVQVVILIA